MENHYKRVKTNEKSSRGELKALERLEVFEEVGRVRLQDWWAGSLKNAFSSQKTPRSSIRKVDDIRNPTAVQSV